MKKAPKLSGSERSELQILHDKSYSARAIARALGRSPNTIATELRRNSYGSDDRTPLDKQRSYTAAYAKYRAYTRRKYAKYQGKKIQDDDELRSFIILKLSAHWNPEEIAGFMKRHRTCVQSCHEHDCTHGRYASKTAIYEWLYSVWGQQYCEHLYTARSRPKKRKMNKAARTMIPDRTSITERPAAAADRAEPGHCEYDSVVSSKRSGSAFALAVVQERSTRLVRARLVPNLRPGHYAETITTLVGGLKTRSLTTDMA